MALSWYSFIVSYVVSNFDFTCHMNEWFWMLLEVDVPRNYHLFREQQQTKDMSHKIYGK